VKGIEKLSGYDEGHGWRESKALSKERGSYSRSSIWLLTAIRNVCEASGCKRRCAPRPTG